MTPRLLFALCLLVATDFSRWLFARNLEELARAPDDFSRSYWSAQCDEVAVELGARYAFWFEAWA